MTRLAIGSRWRLVSGHWSLAGFRGQECEIIAHGSAFFAYVARFADGAELGVLAHELAPVVFVPSIAEVAG